MPLKDFLDSFLVAQDIRYSKKKSKEKIEYMFYDVKMKEYISE